MAAGLVQGYDDPYRTNDALDFEAPGAFDAVLGFGLLQILPREAIERLVRAIGAWTRPGGTVFLTGAGRGPRSLRDARTDVEVRAFPPAPPRPRGGARPGPAGGAATARRR